MPTPLLNLSSSEQEAENTERPRGTALVDLRIVPQGLGGFEVRAATNCAVGEGAGTDEAPGRVELRSRVANLHEQGRLADGRGHTEAL